MRENENSRMVGWDCLSACLWHVRKGKRNSDFLIRRQVQLNVCVCYRSRCKGNKQVYYFNPLITMSHMWHIFVEKVTNVLGNISARGVVAT